MSDYHQCARIILNRMETGYSNILGHLLGMRHHTSISACHLPPHPPFSAAAFSLYHLSPVCPPVAGLIPTLGIVLVECELDIRFQSEEMVSRSKLGSLCPYPHLYSTLVPSSPRPLSDLR